MRRPPPVWERGRRPQSALPTDVIGAAGAVTLFWIVLFGIRRGPFVLIILVASVGMLAVSIMRMPRHQDLLMTHQGILVLGAGSAVVLFMAFVILGVVARRLPAIGSGTTEAFGRAGGMSTIASFLVLFIVVSAEELFWRGFVQGRLADELGSQRGYRLALLGHVLCHLLTFNLALAAAAAICGGLWGWFRLRTGSLVPGLISHLLWTLLMYHVYPI